MLSADRRYVMVYNGEIYNFREIRRSLESRGYIFETDSDTEVVLAAFQQSGISSFWQFNGMFSIAIWDRQAKRLVLARDRFGQKPLYIRRLPHGISFGSEIKSLLAGENVPRTLNFAALHEFAFFGNALGTQTLFSEIERVLPGNYLVVDEDGVSGAAFFDIASVPSSSDNFETATGRVTDLLDRAVSRHLVSDVPVGVLLSGGVDSSAIATLAGRSMPIKTFTVGFDFDPGELPLTRKIARHAGTDHHEFIVRGANLADVLQDLVRHHDQPFSDAANVPLYLLARELKGQLKVVLQGDGGDEVFGGYRRYSALGFDKIWNLVGPMRHVLDMLP